MDHKKREANEKDTKERYTDTKLHNYGLKIGSK